MLVKYVFHSKARVVMKALIEKRSKRCGKGCGNHLISKNTCTRSTCLWTNFQSFGVSHTIFVGTVGFLIVKIATFRLSWKSGSGLGVCILFKWILARCCHGTRTFNNVVISRVPHWFFGLTINGVGGRTVARDDVVFGLQDFLGTRHSLLGTKDVGATAVVLQDFSAFTGSGFFFVPTAKGSKQGKKVICRIEKR